MDWFVPKMRYYKCCVCVTEWPRTNWPDPIESSLYFNIFLTFFSFQNKKNLINLTSLWPYSTGKNKMLNKKKSKKKIWLNQNGKEKAWKTSCWMHGVRAFTVCTQWSYCLMLHKRALAIYFSWNGHTRLIGSAARALKSLRRSMIDWIVWMTGGR